MALGGGTFLVQNKTLPGSYINFVSAFRASATLSDRGYAAMALELDWGPEGEVFTVDTNDFQDDTRVIFGYDYTHAKIKGLRDFFINAKVGYFYRLNNGAVKAQNTFATALYGGIRGNDIKIIIAANVDDPAKFDVTTMIDNTVLETQTVATAADLVANKYVTFKAGATLAATAATPLTGGTNGAAITGAEYQAALDAFEAYSFNTLGCLSTDDVIKRLYVAYTKRMRDEVGVKFQTVIHNLANVDYEGVITIKNDVTDAGEAASAAVWWFTGASAGCLVNRSNTNKTYDGEYTINTNYKQSELTQGIKDGYLMFHKVGDKVKVLNDVNSFTSVTAYKNSDFSLSQVIRVLDQIGNDIAALFNAQYLGKIQNDNSGRVSFWKDIVFYHQQMEQIQAIENFVPKDVIVEKGNTKDSVVVTNPVTPVVAMQRLYMTVIVS